MDYCPKCGCVLQTRDGLYGKFLFCPNVYKKTCSGFTKKVNTPPEYQVRYRNEPNQQKGKKCAKHGNASWIESIPVGAGYCRACVQEEYKRAPRCPHCGDKVGFSMGTGDCNCGED